MSNFITTVKEDFDIHALAEELCSTYQAKGYTVRNMNMKNSSRIVIEKRKGGINMILGLGESITATITKQGSETLIVSFSDGDWISKIIGWIVGLFCCIPFITAIIGVVRQLALPKNIENDIAMLISEKL